MEGRRVLAPQTSPADTEACRTATRKHKHTRTGHDSFPPLEYMLRKTAASFTLGFRYLNLLTEKLGSKKHPCWSQ